MKYSIIIPMYNVSNYIVSCIKSILQDNLKETEIIVVDDASTDNSLENLEKYVNEHNLSNVVKIYTKENEGASAARNYGIEKSSGDYILFMDSDDTMAVDSIEYIYNVVNNHPEDDLFVFSLKKKIGEKIVDSHLSEVPCFEIQNNNSIDLINEYLNATKYIITWQPWSKVFRRDIINNNHIRFDKSLYCCNDFNFFFKYLLYTKSIRFENFVTTVYTIDRPGSISITKTYRRALSMLKAYSFAFNSILEYNKKNQSQNCDIILDYMSYLYLSGLELSWYLKNDELNNIKQITKKQKYIYNFSKRGLSLYKRFLYNTFGLHFGAYLISMTRNIHKTIFHSTGNSEI